MGTALRALKRVSIRCVPRKPYHSSIGRPTTLYWQARPCTGHTDAENQARSRWRGMMKPNSYKAAIFRGPDSVDLIDLPYPACGDDDAIVRNLLTGVCGSDVAAYKLGGDDHMIWKDHEFGHESISE